MVEHQFRNVEAFEALSQATEAGEAKNTAGKCLKYFLKPVAAGCWIGIDDLEFRAEDDLSGDDIAQVLFLLTGGTFDLTGSFGKCGGYQVIYESANPAQLVLKPTHSIGYLAQPTLYYSD